jgi:hypothetical protein
MKTKFLPFCAGIAVLLLSSICLPAAVIFDNLNTPNGSSSVMAGRWWAQSFTVGSGSDYSLTSVILRMAAPLDTSGNFFVAIYDAAGAGGVPRNNMGTLIGSANPATAGDYTYTGSLSLSANTTYYVVAGVSSGGGIYTWGYEAPLSIETGSTMGYDRSMDQGVSWTPLSLTYAHNMQVNGLSAVPEPGQCAAMMIMALVCAGVVGMRHWPRKQASKAVSQ